MSDTLTSLPCYYINLQRSTERHAHMQAIFADLKISIERIDAVDGHNLTPQQNAMVSTSQQWKRVLSHAEVGCFLSHRRAWEQVVNQSQDYAAIFEDDIKLSRDAGELLSSTNWIPAGTSCIKLDVSSVPYYRRKTLRISQTQFAMGLPVWNLLSAAGYIISRESAKMLLERTKTIVAPVDAQMFCCTDKTFLGLKFHQLEPPICVQQCLLPEQKFLPDGAEMSAINPHHPPMERMPFSWRKILRELRRPFRGSAKILGPILLMIRLRTTPTENTFAD